MFHNFLLTFAIIKDVANVASLNILSLHNSVEVGASVAQAFLVLPGVALAQLSKILGGGWAHVVEKLDDHFLWHRNVSVGHVDVDVGTTRRVINQIFVCISGHFLVNHLRGVVDVSKLLNGPLHEVVNGANVLRIVQKDNQVALVVVEIALLFILKILQEVVPLSREEALEVGGLVEGNQFWVCIL